MSFSSARARRESTSYIVPGSTPSAGGRPPTPRPSSSSSARSSGTPATLAGLWTWPASRGALGPGPTRYFGALRQLGGLEVSISVLITAEIIAKVYYAALRDSTESSVLRRICDQFLRDEREHVRFHCDYLALLRGSRRPFLFALTEAAQRFLFFGTCLVVWKFHNRAIRKGGMGFSRFWRGCWREMNAAMRHVRSGPKFAPGRSDLASVA